MAGGSCGRTWVGMVIELTDSDSHVKDTFIREFKNNLVNKSYCFLEPSGFKQNSLF